MNNINEHIELCNLLSITRANSTNEKLAQLSVENVLKGKGYNFIREYRLSNKDIPDFLINLNGNKILIELKVKSNKNKKSIYNQLKRYSEYEGIDGYMLCSNFEQTLKDEMELYIPPFTNVKEFLDYSGQKIVHKYEFALVVEDKNLFGEVNGIYCNQTSNKKLMIRKIKRLLRVKNINIVYVDNLKKSINEVKKNRHQE